MNTYRILAIFFPFQKHVFMLNEITQQIASKHTKMFGIQIAKLHFPFFILFKIIFTPNQYHGPVDIVGGKNKVL